MNFWGFLVGEMASSLKTLVRDDLYRAAVFDSSRSLCYRCIFDFVRALSTVALPTENPYSMREADTRFLVLGLIMSF